MTINIYIAIKSPIQLFWALGACCFSKNKKKSSKTLHTKVAVVSPTTTIEEHKIATSRGNTNLDQISRSPQVCEKGLLLVGEKMVGIFPHDFAYEFAAHFRFKADEVGNPIYITLLRYP